MFKVMSFSHMLARNCFLHWPIASLTTFCDVLAHVSMRHWFKWLVTANGIVDRCLYNVHTFQYQSTNSVVNRTVWRTLIWREKVLLKELEWCWTISRTQSNPRTRHFRGSYLKANKVSKSEGTRKVEHAYRF